MSEVKVTYRFIKHTPRKVRALADLIRGKSYDWSMAQLENVNRRASKPVSELLKSGYFAAKDKDIDLESLFVKEIRVDEGPRLKRRRYGSRGRASMVMKRMTHLTIILDNKKTKEKKDKKTKKNIQSKPGEKNGSQSKSN